ncbi:MAG TPA: cytochrome c-type biogenesis protein [Gemmatimonadaceae bacterium]|nr:cytochrome c-type biogenesis protein [Gemmatimonadaceae bacterium]
MRIPGWRPSIRLIALTLLAALASTAGSGSAQQPPEPPDTSHYIAPLSADTARSTDPTLEAMTRKVAGELRCPVCQGLSINDSPAELAVQMKDVIRDKLAAGETPEEVKAYFIERYGEWVLLAPDPRGINLAVYILPALALLGGAGMIVFAVRRWLPRSKGPVIVASEPFPDESELEQDIHTRV